MPDSTPQPGRLKRQLGLGHAVLLGLGSILGTGVFVSIGIAAGIAGPAVLLAIVLAGLLALCNGLSSAQLAAAHPVAGGTYEYAYRYLHPKLGFTAGWMFLLAKSASAATALILLGKLAQSKSNWHWGYSSRPFRNNAFSYLVELPTQNIPMIFVSFTVLVVCMFAVISGLRRGKALNALLVLLAVIGIVLFSYFGAFEIPRLAGYSNLFEMVGWHKADWTSLFWATAFVFVAFTGYGRIATLGEEVVEPRHTIPRAIVLTLGLTMFFYLLAGLAMLPITRMPQIRHDALGAIDYPFALMRFGRANLLLQVLVYLAALSAMVGVLFNLILGLSRVVLAMARRGDLPFRYAVINSSGESPTSAVLLVGILIAIMTAIGNIKTAWSFAAFTVLIYYGITNWAALRLPKEDRLYPRAFAWAGLGGCFFLCWFVEPIVWLIGLALIVVGLLWHSLAPRMFGRPADPSERCIACGYDLRASTGACPECGKPIPLPET